jgi:hypothetical protein
MLAAVKRMPHQLVVVWSIRHHQPTLFAFHYESASTSTTYHPASQPTLFSFAENQHQPTVTKPSARVVNLSGN